MRSLLSARTFATASLATIALCTAAACTVFALLDAVLLRPLPFEDPDRLVGMWHTLPGVGVPVAKQSLGTYVLYRENAKSFEETGLFVSLATTVSYPGSQLPPERVRGAWMTPSAFRVLRVRPLLGRLLSDSDAVHGAPNVALIGERLWRARFAADRAIVGKQIDVDGTPHTIVGVMPASFAFPSANTPLWTPLAADHPVYLGSFGFDGIGRLRQGVTPKAAQRELANILPRAVARFPEQRPGLSTAVVLRQARMAPLVHPMRDDVIAGFDHVLWLIAAAVALVVIVAFSNVASLTLVRVESRHRELAVRRALGASTAAIWRDLSSESGMLAAVGTLLGLLGAWLAVNAVVSAAPINVPRLNEVRLDGPVVALAAALALLFAGVSAMTGLLRAGGHDALSMLRASARATTGGRASQRLRGVFVAIEVAMSVVLLAGSAVLGRSMLRLAAVQPGFDPRKVFTFWTFLPSTSYHTTADAARFYRDAIERIARMPGVVSVAATGKVPLEVEGFPYRVTVWGDDGTSPSAALPPVVQATTTTDNYFTTMRIPLIAGRAYEDANVRRGAFEAVVSRGYVQQVWHDPTGRSGVGKRIRMAPTGPWFTIVGVVDDVRDSTLTLPAVAEVYFPEEPNADTTGTSNTTGRDMAFVVRTRSDDPRISARLERELRAIDPNLPFHRPGTMEQLVADSRASMTFAFVVFGSGAAAALVLGIVGLYGAIAFAVSLRTRELSIRIALGLDPTAAPRLMLREGLAVVASGAAVGLLLFISASRLLGSLTFDVRTYDPPALATALATVCATAIVAIWLPASRASRVNPLDALNAD